MSSNHSRVIGEGNFPGHCKAYAVTFALVNWARHKRRPHQMVGTHQAGMQIAAQSVSKAFRLEWSAFDSHTVATLARALTDVITFSLDMETFAGSKYLKTRLS